MAGSRQHLYWRGSKFKKAFSVPPSVRPSGASLGPICCFGGLFIGNVMISISSLVQEVLIIYLGGSHFSQKNSRGLQTNSYHNICLSSLNFEITKRRHGSARRYRDVGGVVIISKGSVVGPLVGPKTMSCSTEKIKPLSEALDYFQKLH